MSGFVVERVASAVEVEQILHAFEITVSLCSAPTAFENTGDTHVFVARLASSAVAAKPLPLSLPNDRVLGAVLFEKSTNSCMVEILDLIITASTDDTEQCMSNVAFALVSAVEGEAKKHAAEQKREQGMRFEYRPWFISASVALYRRETLLFWLSTCGFSVISAIKAAEDVEVEARPYLLCAAKETKKLARALKNGVCDRNLLSLCGALSVAVHVPVDHRQTPFLTLCKGGSICE